MIAAWHCEKTLHLHQDNGVRQNSIPGVILFVIIIGYLNREDWTKQFISKNLQITHSQWIFRNISFHDKKNGHLQNKMVDELLQHINSFSEVSPEELPDSSNFLLEINFSKLSKHHLETQQ